MTELLFCFLFSVFFMSTCADEVSALLQMLQGASGGGKCLTFDSPMEGGDGISNVVPVQPGLELVLIIDTSALCQGQVGETKMCMCMADACKVKRGKRNRLPFSLFPSSCFLLVGGGVNMSWGFLAPALDATTTNLEPSLI